MERVGADRLGSSGCLVVPDCIYSLRGGVGLHARDRHRVALLPWFGLGVNQGTFTRIALECGSFGVDILLCFVIAWGIFFAAGANLVFFLCRSVLGVRALPPSAARPSPGRECCLRRAPRAPPRPRPRRPRWHGRHRGARSLDSADHPRLRVGFALST